MKQLNLEDLSQQLLNELELNYGISPDEELKQVYLLEQNEYIVVTSSRAVIHTSELNLSKNLNSVIPTECELNKLGNLQVELEEVNEPSFSHN